MIDVAVVGSLHLDIVVDAPRLPMRDETLMGQSWFYKCGGKGGNQAVAAARLGARTAFGGQTGADDFGERLRANLVAAGVDIGCLDRDPAHGSGMSVAISEASGEYGAVVVSGSNRTIDVATVSSRWAALWSCKVLVLQNEVPEEVNLLAARLARESGARIVLNAAPARELSPALLDLVDILVVNRIEARMLSGMSKPEAAAQALHSLSRDVVVTLGGEGLLFMPRCGAMSRIEALKVNMISSHGAGDFFCGALAARLVAGGDLPSALRFASAAAALLVSTPVGGQAEITAASVARLMV